MPEAKSTDPHKKWLADFVCCMILEQLNLLNIYLWSAFSDPKTSAKGSGHPWYLSGPRETWCLLAGTKGPSPSQGVGLSCQAIKGPHLEMGLPEVIIVIV